MCYPGQIPGGAHMPRPQGPKGAVHRQHQEEPGADEVEAAQGGHPHQGDLDLRLGEEHPHLHRHTYGRSRDLKEGRHRPHRGAAV